LAPSGGNSQPWHWEAAGRRVNLFLDANRSGNLVDFDSGGSYVALGCAAENLILTAHALGLEVRLTTFPSERDPLHVASFDLLSSTSPGCEPHGFDKLAEQIPSRHTNRRLGSSRPLPEGTLGSLTTAARSIAGAQVQWLTGAAEIAQIGQLMGAIDRLRILDPGGHQEMFAELRWSAEEAQSTGDGIEVDSLELCPSDRAGLELARDREPVELLRQWGGGHRFETLARKAARGSAAIGLITVPNARPVDYFLGGRAVQRLWLTATQRRLGVQPMTALAYFFARLLRGGGVGFHADMISELKRLRPIYEKLFAVTKEMGEVLLFRIATDATTAKGSERRPLDDVLIGR